MTSYLTLQAGATVRASNGEKIGTVEHVLADHSANIFDGLVIDTRIDSSALAMIKDLTSGDIDAAILWGPMAGFYAKNANPPLHVTPLVKETTGPRLVYRIGMGVRSADQNWKRQLNRLIQENQPAINKVLLDFGVPILDENNRPIGPEAAAKSP